MGTRCNGVRSSPALFSLLGSTILTSLLSSSLRSSWVSAELLQNYDDSYQSPFPSVPQANSRLRKGYRWAC